MTITNAAFTGGKTEEAGLFEELMRSVSSHIEQQYKSNRIDGKDFANVYLSALQSAMQMSSQFILSKDTANQQELLLQAQVIGQEKQNLLLDAQLAKLEADTALSVKQLDLLNAQEDLAIQQVAKEAANTANITKQTEIGTKQLSVMDSTIAQTDAQASLIEQQEANALAENANITKTGNQIDANVAVLTQKQITEEAQTSGTVTADSSSIGGLVGAQAQLYMKQKDGYDRDAEQKAAKIYADFYSITRSTDTDIYPSAYGANGTNCIDVFDVLRSGIGVGSTDRTTTEV